MASTTFGHYRVEGQIGQGGMGEVFRAFDTRLNRPVAVKVLRAAADAQAVAVERFLREARAASALNHPNIVIIHEVGSTPEGEHFIVQELIDGRTLRALLREPISLASVAEIGAQIARALGAAHAAGIVHRDIKPENIMVRSDGYVKVLDFGLARALALEAPADDAEEITHAALDTTPGVLMGTPSYMSPERVNGLPFGPPTDMFALGVVLYEMAAGRRPFVAPSGLGTVTAIVSEQPVPLARVNPSIPPKLDELVLRLLDKAPERRPTAAEVEKVLISMQRADAADEAAVAVLERTTVGREAQRAALRRAYAAVKKGRSLILAVTGEPGIGKTSLIEDFLSEVMAGSAQPTLARGRCSERLAGSEAYLPVLEVLDSLLHRTTGPSLDAVMKAVAPTWYVQVATRTLEQAAIADLGERAPVSQERMKRELGALLQELSRVQPLVLFIDDLHWADVSTIDILNYLAGRFSDLRVLVLTSYRPSDMAVTQHPFLGIRSDLQSRGVFEEIELHFLELEDVQRYLALQFPGHRLPADFASIIHTKTEGSPLFMADLVRYLRDSGGIVEENGSWVLASALPDTPRDLPASVRGMITRKIEQVDDQDRRLLLAASVQGSEFDSAVIAEAADMEAAEVEDRLDRLERVHVFVRRGAEQEFPDRSLTLTYQFVHVLYQNMLYASLQPTRRVALSGRVARALLARYGTDTASIASQLAVLLEGARDFGASAAFFLTAAQHASGLFGFREAASLADRGLNGLRALPDGAARKQQELALQMIKGRALRSTKGWAAPELEPVFARARQLCQELNDPPELFPVMCSLAHFHMISGNLRECRDRADELILQAEQAGNPVFQMGAHHLAGVSREFIGDMVGASRHLERARELHVPAEHQAYTAMYGFDPGMLARAMTSRPLWALGYPQRAEARARETLAMARTQQHPTTLAFALVVMQGIHLYTGRAAEALAIGEEMVPLCREYELRQEAEWSRSFQGSALAGMGRLAEGIALLKDTLAVQQAIGTGLVRPTFLGLLADALRLDDRPEEGLQAATDGLAYAEQTFQGGYVAELHRVRGELLRLVGNADAAEASLRTALEHARGQQAKSFELRAATALARLLHASGRSPEAGALLAPIYEWFTEGHSTADLRAARAALSDIS